MKPKRKKPFVVVPSPFGTPGFNDERATQDAFVEYVGGPGQADQLSRIYQNSYPHGANDMDPYYKTKDQVFRIRALRDGFTDEDVDAFFSL